MPDALLQLHLTDHPMVVISHRVKPGCEAAFQAWTEGIATDMEAAPGFLARQAIPPVPGAQPEWVSVFHFDSMENLKGWIHSETRARWLTQALPLVEQQWRSRLVGGLDHFFGLLPEAPEPAVWKLAVLTELGLFPVVMLVNSGLSKGWPGLANWLQTALCTSICVSVLAWGVMPLLTRLFQPWLQPGPAGAGEVRS